MTKVMLKTLSATAFLPKGHLATQWGLSVSSSVLDESASIHPSMITGATIESRSALPDIRWAVIVAHATPAIT